MKKFIFLPLVLFSILSFGQARFVVQNGTTKVFSNINSAITAANAGDTLYIPGGGFAIANTNIDKTLHWIGAGHYPDSTSATGQTRITSSLNFSGNCDNSSFEGIYFVGNLVFGSSGNDAVNVSIKKCRVAGELYLRAHTTDSAGIDFHIKESVLGRVFGNYGSNCLIEKTMFFGNVHYFYQSVFDHCIFAVPGEVLYKSSFCMIKNSAIAYGQNFSYSSNIELYYNLFQSSLPYDPVTSTFTGSNNLTNVGHANVFKTIIGNVFDFSYNNNYNLKAGSPGIGAAEDGTDMGIYGSALPYKDGAVPFYPHIRNVQIDNSATNGQLGVKITVAAQER